MIIVAVIGGRKNEWEHGAMHRDYASWGTAGNAAS